MVRPKIICGALRPPSAGDAAEHLVGDAVHDLADVAIDIGMQAAEIRHAGRRTHAAEKP